MPIYVGNNKVKPNGIKEAYVGNNKVYSAKKYYYYIYFMKDGVKYYTKADTTNSIIVPTTNINEATAWDVLTNGNSYQITEPTSGNYWTYLTSGDRLSLSTTGTLKIFRHDGDIFNAGTNIYYTYGISKFYVKLKSDGTKLIMATGTTDTLTLVAEAKEE